MDHQSSFRYARVEVNVSAPIIPFRETIIPPPKVDLLNESLATQQQQFKSGKAAKEKPAWLLGSFLQKKIRDDLNYSFASLIFRGWFS